MAGIPLLNREQLLEECDKEVSLVNHAFSLLRRRDFVELVSRQTLASDADAPTGLLNLERLRSPAGTTASGHATRKHHLIEESASTGRFTTAWHAKPAGATPSGGHVGNPVWANNTIHT